MRPSLQIKDLKVSFSTKDGEIQAVRGVSFDLYKGDALGIVGESGSGKSVMMLSVLKLLAASGKIASGQILYNGMDLADVPMETMRDIRGKEISMIFQDPMSSLNPLLTVGKQVSEVISIHKKVDKRTLKAMTIDLLKSVRIPEPEKRYACYPHEFSGGMRQRVMIAMALALKPGIIIADEPTTALDVTIQDQILKLMKAIQKDMGMSIIFITHDLSVIAELCTRTIVMYCGMVMEEASVDELFDNPSHPYTLGLLRSMPLIDYDKEKKLVPIPGSPPDMLRPPNGCPFAPRCQYARNICHMHMPPYFNVSDKHRSMCWLLDENAPGENNPFRGNSYAQSREVG